MIAVCLMPFDGYAALRPSVQWASDSLGMATIRWDHLRPVIGRW